MVRPKDGQFVSDDFLNGVFEATLKEAKRLREYHGETHSLEHYAAVVAEAAMIPLVAIVARGTEGLESELETLCDEFIESINQLAKGTN